MTLDELDESLEESRRTLSEQARDLGLAYLADACLEETERHRILAALTVDLVSRGMSPEEAMRAVKGGEVAALLLICITSAAAAQGEIIATGAAWTRETPEG